MLKCPQLPPGRSWDSDDRWSTCCENVSGGACKSQFSYRKVPWCHGAGQYEYAPNTTFVEVKHAE